MISVVIPCRRGSDPAWTIRTIEGQDFDGSIEVIIAEDPDGRGANWARNNGARKATGELLLFSDDDVAWEPGALRILSQTLRANPRATYAYGSYEMGGEIFCDREFSAAALRRTNFVSTMSMLWRAEFPGFDESIGRLQDWDLWLTLLARGKVGVSCGQLIFRTKVRDGITINGPVSWVEARRRIAEKHQL